MTVNTTSARSGPFTPNGVTTAYPFTFQAASASELKVVIDGNDVSSSLYTVSLNADQSNFPGGTINFTSAPFGVALYVESDPLFTQEADFANAGPFLLETVDDALDRSALRDIKLQEQVDRAILVPVGTPVPDWSAFIATVKGDPGGDASSIGLKVQAPLLNIADGMDIVATSGADALDHGGAAYVEGNAPTARSGFTSLNNKNYVLSREQVIVPQMFYEATDPDAQNMMEAARDYLKTFALGTGGGGFYKGSPILKIPGGMYDMHAPFDINHTIKIEGEGSGELSPQAFGVTCLRWTAGSSGIRIQSAVTEGDTAISGVTHDGAGGAMLSDMCLLGGFAGAEGEFHGLVCRNAPKVTRLYIKNWQGEGVKAWAGNVSGFGNVAGNNSTAKFDGVKVEDCRGAFDIRGSDSNVIVVDNCEGYACRRFGYLDDNGAGSNTLIGFHAASNGVVNGSWAQTQCSYSGNRYALKWGGDPTVAPSGTTADTANWFYIEAGGAIANTIPAWTATPNTFRAGGDYLTLNSAGVHMINPYSEGGGFSQLNFNTIMDHGSVGKQYYRGGWRWIPSNAGLVYKTSSGGGALNLETTTGEIGLFAQDETATPFAYIDFLKNGPTLYSSSGGHKFRKNGADKNILDENGLQLIDGAQIVTIGGQKVLASRFAKPGSPALSDVIATLDHHGLWG